MVYKNRSYFKFKVFIYNQLTKFLINEALPIQGYNFVESYVNPSKFSQQIIDEYSDSPAFQL